MRTEWATDELNISETILYGSDRLGVRLMPPSWQVAHPAICGGGAGGGLIARQAFVVNVGVMFEVNELSDKPIRLEGEHLVARLWRISLDAFNVFSDKLSRKNPIEHLRPKGFPEDTQQSDQRRGTELPPRAFIAAELLEKPNVRERDSAQIGPVKAYPLPNGDTLLRGQDKSGGRVNMTKDEMNAQ